MGLLWEHSALQFFVLTVFIGGGAAWLAGRALALAWRPFWHALAYSVLLGLAVRFFHYALLEGTLLSPWYCTIDTLVLIALAALAYRSTRTTQMVTQYPWLYRRTNPLNWTAK